MTASRQTLLWVWLEKAGQDPQHCQPGGAGEGWSCGCVKMGVPPTGVCFVPVLLPTTVLPSHLPSGPCGEGGLSPATDRIIVFS